MDKFIELNGNRNKKSKIYENNMYHVKISDIKGSFPKKNNSNNPYIPYNSDLDDEAILFSTAVKLEVTNKNTGKTASKQCYQGYRRVIDDLQNDLDQKKQFKDIFDKID